MAGGDSYFTFAEREREHPFGRRERRIRRAWRYYKWSLWDIAFLIWDSVWLFYSIATRQWFIAIAFALLLLAMAVMTVVNFRKRYAKDIDERTERLLWMVAVHMFLYRALAAKARQEDVELIGGPPYGNWRY